MNAQTRLTKTEDQDHVAAELVSQLFRVGRLWARHGLDTARQSLKTTAETLDSTARTLQSLRDRFDDPE